MSDSVTAQMEKILEGYDQQVVDISREAAKEAAEVTARTLQNTSPKKVRGRGRGRYARGWTYKVLEDGILTSYVVYNKNNAGLTQNLEFGHVVRNQFGTWGRARAIPHIAPAADAGIQRFELGVRARLRRLK